MSALSKVMLWAVRVNAYGKEAKAHQILDLKPDATLDDAQRAFHEIARIAHPDLHRATLSAEDLETVTTAYARVAGAYQDIRTQRMSTARLKPFDKTPSGGIPRTPLDQKVATPSADVSRMPTENMPRISTDKIPTQGGISRMPTDKVPTQGDIPRMPNEKVPTPIGGIPRISTGTPPPGTGAAGAMSSKALIYYRKAELSLRRGDLKGAVLQIKMAIAADPQSSFLRTALAEIEAELGKTP